MPRLLLSIRDPQEAAVALQAGADFIDIKNPEVGSLGRPSSTIVQICLKVIANQVPVSCALGDLPEETPIAAPPLGVAYLKLGLAGCASQSCWQERYLATLQSWPAEVRRVGVIYADWQRADAPSPQETLAVADAAGCQVVLIDTFIKDGLGLLQTMPAEQLDHLCQQIRRSGKTLALAGSLRLESAAGVLPLNPDILAVRGGACRGHRTGPLDLELAKQWKQLLSNF